jgi:hypothetical protein
VPGPISLAHQWDTLMATLASSDSGQHVVERSFIPPVLSLESAAEHRVQVIRASSTTVSRRSILPTGNLASLC